MGAGVGGNAEGGGELGDEGTAGPAAAGKLWDKGSAAGDEGGAAVSGGAVTSCIAGSAGAVAWRPLALGFGGWKGLDLDGMRHILSERSMASGDAREFGLAGALASDSGRVCTKNGGREGSITVEEGNE